MPPARFERLLAFTPPQELPQALEVLGERGNPAVPLILPLVDHPDDRVRRSALDALEGCTAPSALRRLEALVADPTTELHHRMLAEDALAFARPLQDGVWTPWPLDGGE